MTHNDIGPLWAEIFYAVGTRLHVQRLPLADGGAGAIPPGGLPSTYLLQDKSTGLIDFENFINDYIPFLQPFFPTSASFTVANLWHKATTDSDPVWKTLVEIGAAGTSISSAVADGQLVMSNRTENGGKFMLYLMESVYAANQKDEFPFAVANWTNLGNYIKGIASPIIGRDGGYIAANIRVVTKTNDALRKRRLLDA